MSDMNSLRQRAIDTAHSLRVQFDNDYHNFDTMIEAAHLLEQFSGAAAPICATCGGSKVDPGGLRSCRDCMGSDVHQAVAPTQAEDGAWHWVIYETLAGERNWVPAQRKSNHWNSTNFSGIPLSEVTVGPAITLAAPVQDVAPISADVWLADFPHVSQQYQWEALYVSRYGVPMAEAHEAWEHTCAKLEAKKAVAKDVAPSDAQPITASIMVDNGGEKTAYCLMAAFRSEEAARSALAALGSAPQAGVQAPVVGWLRNERGDATGLATHDPLFLLGNAEPPSGYTATYSPVAFAAPAAPQAVPDAHTALPWPWETAAQVLADAIDHIEGQDRLKDALRILAAQPAAQPADAQPFAYLARAENGNTIIWSVDPATVRTAADKYGRPLEALHLAPATVKESVTVAADAQDAERYRVIRAAALSADVEFSSRMMEASQGFADPENPTSDEFDASIDAARTQGGAA